MRTKFTGYALSQHGAVRELKIRAATEGGAAKKFCEWCVAQKLRPIQLYAGKPTHVAFDEAWARATAKGGN